MTLEGVPWYVRGAVHSPEVARVLAYAASGGREGIIGTTDLKVKASNIPDGNIHIQPGAGVALNRFGGGASQAYVVRNVGDEVKAMTAQGSSGARYDLVALIVEDPDYAGQPDPADPEDGPFVRVAVYEGVSSTTKFLYEVDADQTGIALARVKFDASDGTVTQSDITDLRQMLFARSYSVTKMLTLTSGTDAIPTGAFDTFPVGAEWDVAIPEWANKVALWGIVMGVGMFDGGADGGTTGGLARIELGSINTDSGGYKENAVGPGKRTSVTFGAAEDELDVAVGLRGTTQTLSFAAYATYQDDMTVQAETGTTVIVTATFAEKAA